MRYPRAGCGGDILDKRAARRNAKRLNSAADTEDRLFRLVKYREAVKLEIITVNY